MLLSEKGVKVHHFQPDGTMSRETSTNVLSASPGQLSGAIFMSVGASGG